MDVLLRGHPDRCRLQTRCAGRKGDGSLPSVGLQDARFPIHGRMPVRFERFEADRATVIHTGDKTLAPHGKHNRIGASGTVTPFLPATTTVIKERSLPFAPAPRPIAAAGRGGEARAGVGIFSCRSFTFS